jgi:hypothetical protein
MRWPVPKVPPLVDEYGIGGGRGAGLDERLDAADVLRYPLGTPDHNRELARRRHEFGAPVRGLVLELRSHHATGWTVADHQVGAQRPPGSCQHRIVVEHKVRQPALADQPAQVSLHGPHQVTRNPELELRVVLQKPVHRLLNERRRTQRKVIHPTPWAHDRPSAPRLPGLADKFALS